MSIGTKLSRSEVLNLGEELKSPLPNMFKLFKCKKRLFLVLLHKANTAPVEVFEAKKVVK